MDRADQLGNAFDPRFGHRGLEGVENLDRRQRIVEVHPCRVERPSPATRNSITSSIVAIPPIPMAVHGLADLIDAPQGDGLDRGPAQSTEHAPPSTGLRCLQSIAIPRQVLISEIASAPPASAARAISATLVTLGVSLATIGCPLAAVQSRTSCSQDAGWVPKSTPPVTLGQEMFSSMAAIPDSAESRCVMTTNSSRVRPAILTTMGTPMRGGEIREVVGNEWLDAVVVEADRIEHPAGCFDRPPGRIASSRLGRDGLRENAAQSGKIDDASKFTGIPEGPRSHEYRVGKLDPSQFDLEFHSKDRWVSDAARARNAPPSYQLAEIPATASEWRIGAAARGDLGQIPILREAS